MAHAFDEEIVFAVAALRRGEIVAYPTETFYGLGRRRAGRAGARAAARAQGAGRTRRSRCWSTGRPCSTASASVVPPLAARADAALLAGRADDRAARADAACRAALVEDGFVAVRESSASHRAGAGGGPRPAAHDHQREPRRRAARDDATRRSRRSSRGGAASCTAARRPAARPARWSRVRGIELEILRRGAIEIDPDALARDKG